MRAVRAVTAALLLSASALAIPGTAAAYPGANGQIAFTSTQDGGARHIFDTGPAGIVDLSADAPTPGDEIQPKFSPDGREIAFTRLAPGLPNSEIFVMSADGGGRTELTRTPQGNSDPTWSPDGTQIAFVSAQDAEGPNIFIMRSDGTHVREITHDSSAKSALAWSPKGGRIAFVREPAGGGDRDIYSIKSDRSGLTDLTNDPGNSDLEPAWSPDGTRLAYSGPLHKGESVGMDLWIMNADGSGNHELFHENNKYSDGAYPAWSPDGTTIAFTANDGTGYYHVWSIPFAGGQNTELVANRVAGGNPVDEEVDWAPRVTTAVPRTEITGVRVTRRAASFSFQATGPATSYRCTLRAAGRKAMSRPCASQQTYGHLRPGRYTFSVIAAGPNEPYRSAARRTFRIGSRPR